MVAINSDLVPSKFTYFQADLKFFKNYHTTVKKHLQI